MTNLQRTNEYWQRRIYRLENELVAGIKVDELYNETYDKLLGDVEELYKRTKGGEPLTRTELYRYSKFLTFKNRLESESKRIGNYLHSEIEKALTEAYRAAGLAAKERLGEKSVWTVQNRRMAKACIERDWAGSNFSKRIWKNRQAMAAAVREGVIDCVINGRTRADFIDVLVKQFGDSENPGAARSRAVTLTRTEVMHTLNTGAIETYASEGVHFLEWDAEPDACGECLELASNNGGIYPINEYPGAIAHPRCRCVPIPVEDDDPRVAGRLGKGDGTKYRGKYPQSIGENVLDISGESGIIETGGKYIIGGDKWRANQKRRDEKATEVYPQIANADNVKAIAKASGLSEDDVREIKNHVFFDKHETYEGIDVFKPDYDMAVAFKRLEKGEPEDRDILLLKHELYESQCEKKYGLTSAEAHAMARKKYDWQAAIEELNDGDGEEYGLL